MLIYGDRSYRAEVREVLAQLQSLVDALGPSDARWIERHGRLVDLFLAAAGLVQGIEDAAFAATGEDRLESPSQAWAGALVALAQAVRLSFDTGILPPPAELRAALAGLAENAPEPAVRIKTPEGHAYYAVYPEAFARAAGALAGTRPVVLGLRSIGTGLGAMVAARTKAALFATLRPVGDPFDRRLVLGADLACRLRAHGETPFSIVDEGPGQSGSSIAGTAAALERLGVPTGRIHFMPSHPGLPSGAVSEASRRRWQVAPRHVQTFDDLAGPEGARLATWVEDITGPALGPLVDVGGGAWRAHRRFPTRPPGGLMRERRKFLLTSTRGTFLLRFAGLGAAGAATAARAMRLAQAGFTPACLGLRHGFLVEPWLAEAAMPAPGVNERALLERVADYLAFRARRLPAGPDDGAALDELVTMVARNAGLLAGRSVDVAALALAARHLAPRLKRVATDNRLHHWEWLQLPDGRLLKADASDHCAGHDLVGCQDIAWDVVGAAVELGLPTGALGRALGERGIAVDPGLVRFYLPCYAAFEAGSFYLDAQRTTEYPDKQILHRQILRYRMIINVSLMP